MTFFEYLSDTFGVNEPIFSSDIKFENYSKPWIAKQLAELCGKGSLARFERGILLHYRKNTFRQQRSQSQQGH